MCPSQVVPVQRSSVDTLVTRLRLHLQRVLFRLAIASVCRQELVSWSAIYDCPDMKLGQHKSVYRVRHVGMTATICIWTT
jgi:hypothetical protein